MILSIISINLNNADGLRKTIESVVNIKSNYIEYIIIDGGSKDGSKNVIQEFSTSIDYWVSETDSGIYHAMNKGIGLANGKYCLFLNSGDYLTENVFSDLILTEFDEQIIYGNILIKYNNGSLIRLTGAGKSILTFYDFFAKSSISHQAAFIRRDLFDVYGLYDVSYSIASDWFFFINVIIMHNVSVRYVDIDISYSDPYGISNTEIEKSKNEGELIISSILPNKIIEDYHTFKKIEEENIQLKIILNRYNYRFGSLDAFVTYVKMAYLRLLTFKK